MLWIIALPLKADFEEIVLDSFIKIFFDGLESD